MAKLTMAADWWREKSGGARGVVYGGVFKTTDMHGVADPPGRTLLIWRFVYSELTKLLPLTKTIF
jgi:hypothetical protein